MVTNGCLWFYSCELILNSGIKYLWKKKEFTVTSERERERERIGMHTSCLVKKSEENIEYIFS